MQLEFKIRTKGTHGAYTHTSESATKLAQRLIGDLEAATQIEPRLSGNVARSLAAARDSIDKAMGKGRPEHDPGTGRGRGCSSFEEAQPPRHSEGSTGGERRGAT
jgi:hypothetical protein